MTVLVTGASGFIGSALCERLLSEGVSVRGAVRTLDKCPRLIDKVAIGGLTPNTDWTTSLRGVRLVVHLAARVHVMNKSRANELVEFRRANVEVTAALARQAAAAGVRRFIFLSSVKVNGEFTGAGLPFRAGDEPRPADPYGVSKYEAEEFLHQIGAETGMEVVIIRPPLVYGPGVKANFASLVHWLSRGLPLPLAAVTKNRRSMVALDNLVDLVVLCMNHPAAANQIFLVSDGEALSTAELCVRLATALGRPHRLFYFPPILLKSMSWLVNRRDVYDRLCGSLEIDDAKTRDLLCWSPPTSINEGFHRAGKSFAKVAE